MPGGHLSRVLGSSSEFTEYRAYRQGDDTRRIDWKLLARTNRAYVRVSNDRTVLSTILVVDASASLAFPQDSMEKWHYARQIALGLAAAVHSTGDPVGVVVATATGLIRLPPRTRRTVLNEIAYVLGDVTPGGSPLLAPLTPILRNAGRIAIISDFLGDAEPLIRAAGRLVAAGREVHPVHVLHGDELDPPGNSTLLTDPEDDSIKRPVTAATRKKYLDNFGAWREEIARGWRMTGAYYNAVVTTEPVARSVRRIAGARS
jgi:uncharacterized protein (DUF58 family)